MITNREELKDRVEAERKRMQARLAELKADSRQRAREEKRAIEAALKDLSSWLDEGWHKMSDEAAHKLNHWLTSARKTLSSYTEKRP